MSDLKDICGPLADANRGVPEESVGKIPQGIEVLVKKAAVDPAFKEVLLEQRAAAAEQIALKLEPAEAMMLAAAPRHQLEAIIARTSVPEEHRRAFLGQAAAAMAATLVALKAPKEFDDEEVGKGSRPRRRSPAPPPAPPPPPPPPLDGGIKILGHPKGRVRVQDMTCFGPGKWKNDDQLYWTQAKPGDRLELGWDVEKDGKYTVSVTLTKARDYGMVQFYLDDKKVGEPIDLYNPEVIPSGATCLGEHQLTKGEHKLSVEIVGANEKAIKAYMFGLDRILLEPAK